MKCTGKLTVIKASSSHASMKNIVTLRTGHFQAGPSPANRLLVGFSGRKPVAFQTEFVIGSANNR